MRRPVSVLFALCLLLLPALPIAAQATGGAEQQYEIVVQLEPSQDPTAYAPYFLTRIGVPDTERAARVNHVYRYALTGFSVFLTEAEIAKAHRLFDGQTGLGIRSIERSQRVGIPDLERVTSQMPESRLKPGHQIVPTGIERINAALTSDQGDLGGVDVAVIDTGVDKRHPDLNVVGGVDCTAAPGEQGDYGHDGFGHGTHVSGTIAARNDGQGVVGVAPGARIWSVKVLGDDGSGSTASVICGIDWVVAHSDVIAVANMSLGGGGFPNACGAGDAMHDAVCVATEKVIFVVAAGNSSADAADFSPADYPEAITVSALADFDGQDGGAGQAPDARCAAMSVDDSLASFSNYGKDVDIAAPGVCILSTVPGDVDANGVYQPAYGYASGTSMATPHVTGAVARFLALNPDQRDWARTQLLNWSKAHGGTVQEGDHDGVAEPILYVGNGIPRHQDPIAPPPGK